MEKELKPVNCGCRGEAKVQRVRTLKSHLIVVMCTKCEIATNYYTNEAEAVQAWNRAMGAKDINVPNKTAKVVRHDACVTVEGLKLHEAENLCGACKKKVLDGDDYCSHCGCRLIWGDDL